MGMTNRGKNSDNVNHPSHYTQGYCETIYEIYDILGSEGFKSYCLGNWIKYKSRAQYKNGDEDLKKAQVYLDWATNGLPQIAPAPDKDHPQEEFLRGDYVVSPYLCGVGEIFSTDAPNDAAIIFIKGIGITVPLCSVRRASKEEIEESKCSR